MNKKEMLQEIKNRHGSLFIRHIKNLSKDQVQEFYNKFIDVKKGIV